MSPASPPSPSSSGRSDPGSPMGSDRMRVGTAEREQAIALLREHYEAGRLDPAEHEARLTKAHDAVTRADLEALFADLPAAGVPATIASLGSAASTEVAEKDENEGTLDRFRGTIVALTPIACVLLFLTSRAPWPIFFAIPIVSILLYGPARKKD